MMPGVSSGDQWKKEITNEDIRDYLNVNPMEEVAKTSRLRWYVHVERMEHFRLSNKMLNCESDA